MKLHPLPTLVWLELRRFTLGVWVEYFLGMACVMLICWGLAWLDSFNAPPKAALALLLAWVPAWVSALLVAGSLANYRNVGLVSANSQRDRRVPEEFLIARPVSRGSIYAARVMVLYGSVLLRCLPLLVWGFLHPAILVTTWIPEMNGDVQRVFHDAIAVTIKEMVHNHPVAATGYVLPDGNGWLMVYLTAYTLAALVVFQVLEALRQNQLQGLFLVVLFGASCAFFLPIGQLNAISGIEGGPDFKFGLEAYLYFAQHAAIILAALVVALGAVNWAALQLFRRRDVM